MSDGGAGAIAQGLRQVAGASAQIASRLKQKEDALHDQTAKNMTTDAEMYWQDQVTEIEAVRARGEDPTPLIQELEKTFDPENKEYSNWGPFRGAGEEISEEFLQEPTRKFQLAINGLRNNQKAFTLARKTEQEYTKSYAPAHGITQQVMDTGFVSLHDMGQMLEVVSSGINSPLASSEFNSEPVRKARMIEPVKTLDDFMSASVATVERKTNIEDANNDIDSLRKFVQDVPTNGNPELEQWQTRAFATLDNVKAKNESNTHVDHSITSANLAIQRYIQGSENNPLILQEKRADLLEASKYGDDKQKEKVSSLLSSLDAIESIATDPARLISVIGEKQDGNAVFIQEGTENVNDSDRELVEDFAKKKAEEFEDATTVIDKGRVILPDYSQAYDLIANSGRTLTSKMYQIKKMNDAIYKPFGPADLGYRGESDEGFKGFPTNHPTVGDSNVLLMGVNLEGKEYVIPTMVGGKKLSEDDAITIAREEGLDNYPSFDTVDAATKWAEANHSRINKDGSFLPEGAFKSSVVVEEGVPFDGDSFTVMQEGKPVEIRLDNYDSPEYDTIEGQQASAYIKKLLTDQEFTVIPKKKGYYGRTIADIRLEDGRDLRKVLVYNDQGHDSSNIGKKLHFEKTDNSMEAREMRVARRTFDYLGMNHELSAPLLQESVDSIFARNTEGEFTNDHKTILTGIQEYHSALKATGYPVSAVISQYEGSDSPEIRKFMGVLDVMENTGGNIDASVLQAQIIDPVPEGDRYTKFVAPALAEFNKLDDNGMPEYSRWSYMNRMLGVYGENDMAEALDGSPEALIHLAVQTRPDLDTSKKIAKWVNNQAQTVLAPIKFSEYDSEMYDSYISANTLKYVGISDKWLDRLFSDDVSHKTFAHVMAVSLDDGFSQKYGEQVTNAFFFRPEETKVGGKVTQAIADFRVSMNNALNKALFGDKTELRRLMENGDVLFNFNAELPNGTKVVTFQANQKYQSSMKYATGSDGQMIHLPLSHFQPVFDDIPKYLSDVVYADPTLAPDFDVTIPIPRYPRMRWP